MIEEKDPYWTHTNMLTKCLLHTQGDILELGCGHYSTAILSAFSEKRKVISVDTNQEWVEQLQGKYQNPNHKFIHIPQDIWDEETEGFTRSNWGLVFVDHVIHSKRGRDLVRFKSVADVIVMHDSDNPENIYRLDEAKPHFKYIYESQIYHPPTIALSNRKKLSWIF